MTNTRAIRIFIYDRLSSAVEPRPVESTDSVVLSGILLTQ